MTNHFELRQDPYDPDLYLMGPYDHGADQLRVNGYSFPGPPEPVLVQAVDVQIEDVKLVAREFKLSVPTLYFVEHRRFPTRVGAFIGESSADPMIALFHRKLLEELVHRKPREFLVYMRGILVHELAHAFVESELGDAGRVEEEAVLRFEHAYLSATNLEGLMATLAGWRRQVEQQR